MTACSPVFRYLVQQLIGFRCGSAGKESTCNVGNLDLIPGLGRCPGEGKGYPLQHSGLQNSIYGCWLLGDFLISSFLAVFGVCDALLGPELLFSLPLSMFSPPWKSVTAS